MKFWVIIGVIAILSFLGLVILTFVEAILDTKKKPRVEMFWCHKHGYFKKEHCLPLFPEMMGTVDGSFVCPTCYKNAVFTEPNKRMYS